VKREPQEKYLQLNERIIAENERSGFVPPCRARPKLFFPEDWFDYYERRAVEIVAKDLCGKCIFENECLSYALSARETAGIWGGLTAKERAHLLRR